jgi:LuxR family quorum sensing-dependent transcriptional regulator
MDVARDFGMNEGYLVPIVRSTGFQACVTMAGSHPDLDPMAKRVIHVVSIMAHGRISALKGESINQKQILTAREREVLHWVSVGKTSWEISTILHLSKSTIDIMVNRAQQKLNAVTRTQAVVNALRAGEINF